ncbi:MAG: permease prefix domain 1-containing protein, partial [Terracidiphilus sp.]
MGMFRNFAAGLRSLFGRAAAEQDLDEELRSFMDASVEEKTRAGMRPDEAARAARVEMGSTNAVKHR